MNSLPTIVDPNNYEFQTKNNETLMEGLFDEMFPGVFNLVPPDALFEILLFLSETKVNPRIIPRVIRGISNLIAGTGSGQVIVHVNGDTMNVSVRENDREIKSKL